MEKIIDGLSNLETEAVSEGWGADNTASRARRRLEECRALLERLANDEPAPEGHTFRSWARELLA